MFAVSLGNRAIGMANDQGHGSGGGYLWGLLGVVVTGVGAFVREVFKNKQDERQALTHDLMTHLQATNERLNVLQRNTTAEIESLRGEVVSLQRKLVSVTRLLGTVGAELQILNGHMGIHLAELMEKDVNINSAKEQTIAMSKAIDRLIATVNGVEVRIVKDLKVLEGPDGYEDVVL